MAAYRRVDDLRSPVGWLPVHQDQLRAQRSVSPLPFFTFSDYHTNIANKQLSVNEQPHASRPLPLDSLPLARLYYGRNA